VSLPSPARLYRSEAICPLILVAAVIAAPMTGCSPVAEPHAEPISGFPNEHATVYARHLGSVTRLDDIERGVTCYVFADFRKGGISCLPTSAGAKP
jgi:hypothetical protein